MSLYEYVKNKSPRDPWEIIEILADHIDRLNYGAISLATKEAFGPPLPGDDEYDETDPVREEMEQSRKYRGFFIGTDSNGWFITYYL